MLQLFKVYFAYLWLPVARQRPHDLVYSCIRSTASDISSLICDALFLHAAIFWTLPMLAQAAIRSPWTYRAFLLSSLSSGVSKNHSVRQSTVALGSYVYRATFSQKKRSICVRTRCHKRWNFVPVIADIPCTLQTWYFRRAKIPTQ